MDSNEQLAQYTNVASQTKLLADGNAPLSKFPPPTQLLEDRNAPLSEVEHQDKNNFSSKLVEQDGDHHDSNIHRKGPADKCQNENEAIQVANAQTTELHESHVSDDQNSESSQVLDKLRKQQTNDDDEDFLEMSNDKLEALKTYVYFHKGFYCQWYYSEFWGNGKRFTCTEQYMMYEKAVLFKDWSSARKILNTTNPKTMKKLGRGVKGFIPHIWVQHCLYIVKEGNLLKKPRLKADLYHTFPKILVEASPHDNVWGIGLDEDNCKAWDERTWEGKNWLGYILTEVRDELMCVDGQIKKNQCKKYLEMLLQKEFDSTFNTEPENSFNWENLTNVNAGNTGFHEKEKNEEIENLDAGTTKEHRGDNSNGGSDKSHKQNEGSQGGHKKLQGGHERSYGGNDRSHAGHERSHASCERSYVNNDRSHEGHERSYGDNDRSHAGYERSFGGSDKSYVGNYRSHAGHERSYGGSDKSYVSNDRSHAGHERSYGGNDRSGYERSFGGSDKSYVGNYRSHAGHERSYGGSDKSYVSNDRSHAGHERSYGGNDRSHAGYERSFGGSEKSYVGNYRSHAGHERSYGGSNKSYAGNYRSHAGHERSYGGNERSHAGYERSFGGSDKLYENNQQLGADPDHVKDKNTSNSLSDHLPDQLQSLSCKGDGPVEQDTSLKMNQAVAGKLSYAAVVAN